MDKEEKEQFKNQGISQGLPDFLVNDVVETVEKIFERLREKNRSYSFSKKTGEFHSEKELIEFLFDTFKFKGY